MVDLTQKEYHKLLKNCICSGEGYIINNPHARNQIIKIIKDIKSDPDFFSIKMYTISLLLKYKNILRNLNIAMPSDIVRIDGIELGYQMPKIRGLLLEEKLYDDSVPFETKINYLKQVGDILRNLSTLRKETELKNLFYIDIHERNFIVDKKDIVYGIDPDSFSILDNTPTSGYYTGELYDLFPTSKKYQFRDIFADCETDVIPDENLDIYSYIRMILNFMAGHEIDNLTKEKLFYYLNYLELHGANKELLYALESIYNDSSPNINPDYLLDYIKEIYQYSSIKYNESGILRRILR